MDQHGTSPSKLAVSPGKPLYSLSPERINQQRLPPSHSVPNNLSDGDCKHHRNSSDVQSKVAFLNSLNQASANTRQVAPSVQAALQRAILGREEAEAVLSSTNEQFAEAQIRERRISERLESLMEELQTVKERQAHERHVFEKEVRRARKEAFRAGSALVKAQEDLKDARSESKSLRADIEQEKSEKEKAKQEAFERAYTLAGMMEEMEEMKGKMRALEAERDATLLEQKAMRIGEQELKTRKSVGTEEDIDIPGEQETAGNEQEAEIISPSQVRSEGKSNHSHDRIPAVRMRKQSYERLLPVDTHSTGPWMNWGFPCGNPEPSTPSSTSSEYDGELDLEEKILDLQGKLNWEKEVRRRADAMVKFLETECRFKTCACRRAEWKIEDFLHDKEDDQAPRAEVAKVEPNADREQGRKTIQKEDILSGSIEKSNTGRKRSSSPLPKHSANTLSEQDLFVLSPPDNSSPSLSQEEMTFELPLQLSLRTSPIRAVPRSPEPSSGAAAPVLGTVDVLPTDTTPHSSHTRSPSASPYPMPPEAFKTPVRSQSRPVHARTITTMIPLRGNDNDDVFSPMPSTPAPGTPISREAALEQIRARRDRARSMVRVNSAPGSARRGLGVALRDTSAPGRF